MSLEDFIILERTVKLGEIETKGKVIYGINENASYSGKYAYDKVYDRIDGSIIMSWIKTYYEAKIDERENLILINKEKKKIETQSLLTETILPEGSNNNITRSFKDISMELMRKKAAEMIQNSKNLKEETEKRLKNNF